MREETFAKHIYDHRIRISGGSTPGGNSISIVDTITGKPIKNVAKVELVLEPHKANEAKLTLVHIGERVENPEGGWSVPVSEEVVTIKDFEVEDIIASADVVNKTEQEGK